LIWVKVRDADVEVAVKAPLHYPHRSAGRVAAARGQAGQMACRCRTRLRHWPGPLRLWTIPATERNVRHGRQSAAHGEESRRRVHRGLEGPSGARQGLRHGPDNRIRPLAGSALMHEVVACGSVQSSTHLERRHPRSPRTSGRNCARPAQKSPQRTISFCRMQHRVALPSSAASARLISRRPRSLRVVNWVESASRRN